MTLEERLGQDQIAAMKGGDELVVSVLRLLRTRVKEAQVEKRKQLTDEEIHKVIVSEINKRREAIELFEKGGRRELAAREEREIGALEAYLPPKLTQEELNALAVESVKEAEATTPRDLGKVMKILMPKVGSRAEGSLVNKIVRELLAEKKD